MAVAGIFIFFFVYKSLTSFETAFFKNDGQIKKEKVNRRNSQKAKIAILFENYHKNSTYNFRKKEREREREKGREYQKNKYFLFLLFSNKVPPLLFLYKSLSFT